MKTKEVIAAHVSAAIFLSSPAGPARAQEARAPDYEAIVRIMRDCARIGGLEERAACYDRAIETERLINAPAARQAPQAPRPRGFGAESLPEPADDRAATPDEIELVVRRTERLEPGIYALTMEDGSKWRFVDAVPMAYDPPRAGSRIELARAALGSFQMRFAKQRPVRIRRIE